MANGGSNAIIITTAVLLGFSLITICLRCFVRLKIVKSFGSDDVLLVAAAVFNVVFAVCGIVGALHGMGKAPAYLSHRPDDVRRGLLCWWLGQIFYVFTCTIARLSIATTLLRLTIQRIHLWVLCGIMVISSAMGTVFLFFTIFQCRPVAHYWNRSSTKGRCLDINILLGIVYMYSGVVAACDFTIGSLPIFMVSRLQMKRGTKFAVSAILGLAYIASVAVIVRIPFLHYAGRPDFLYETTQISIWSNVEASLGIAAGSLMTLRPLLRVLSNSGSSATNQHRRVTSFPMLSSCSDGEDLQSPCECQTHSYNCGQFAN
ncbi:hypothetical protein ACN38_g1158 [Penicillium nordicum]|uniref:Rhodopsin domain-containing protein n=1 Tax=Penicillium nordicum TaxID=229535 RepID=A0A0M9WK26_9EURO|nr:hypothetical protein ACN38_g1158 [Penicillium nordicum]